MSLNCPKIEIHIEIEIEIEIEIQIEIEQRKYADYSEFQLKFSADENYTRILFSRCCCN